MVVIASAAHTPTPLERLIGTYCIYPSLSKQCGPRAGGRMMRVITECLSSGNFR